MRLKLLAGICLFLLSGCYTKEEVVVLPEAENLFFTDQGRLFVSAGVGFFEMVQSNGQFELEKLNEFDCSFAGITQVSHFLYTLCYETGKETSRKYLYAMDLNDSGRSLSVIYDLSEFKLPNGLTSNGEDALYIANSAYLSKGSILKAQLTSDLRSVELFDANWATQDQGVYNPNGIKWLNDELWFSDLGSIKRMSVLADGKSQMAQPFVDRLTVFDDIVPHCEGVLATDFVAGRLVFFDANGDVKYQTRLASFQGASSLLVGKPPMFNSNQLVATERGILLERNSRIGNRVSTADFEFDLNQCSALN